MRDLLLKTKQGLQKSRENWFNKVTLLFDRSSIPEETWDELEELLIAADVGVSTTDKLLQRVKERIKAEQLVDSHNIQAALQDEIVRLLRVNDRTDDTLHSDKLRLILVVGVNGSGKTTSIAKLASELTEENNKVILAAADTFRAAAIDQLKLWGERIGVDVVAHQPGGDPGAVVFDAIQAAQKREAQIVIVDTAGRLHTKFNLMEELKKIRRVADKYDVAQEVLLVIDATTGQNGLIQARAFTEAAGVDGIILSKLDGTAKGGIVLAICDELQIPITHIGTGEKLDDLAPFDADTFVEAMFST